MRELNWLEREIIEELGKEIPELRKGMDSLQKGQASLERAKQIASSIPEGSKLHHWQNLQKALLFSGTEPGRMHGLGKITRVDGQVLEVGHFRSGFLRTGFKKREEYEWIGEFTGKEKLKSGQFQEANRVWLGTFDTGSVHFSGALSTPEGLFIGQVPTEPNPDRSTGLLIPSPFLLQRATYHEGKLVTPRQEVEREGQAWYHNSSEWILVRAGTLLWRLADRQLGRSRR